MTRRAVAVAAVLGLMSSGCTRNNSPVGTILGGLMVGGGALAIHESPNRCDDGCVSISEGDALGTLLIIVGVPMLVIGGLAWLHYTFEPAPPAPTTQPPANTLSPR
jgi:hypothetical protein